MRGENDCGKMVVMKKYKEEKAMNYTYIVKCSDATLYTGWTNHLEKRMQDYNAGKGWIW